MSYVASYDAARCRKGNSITAPISIVGSSDEQSLRLLALAHREGKELRSRFSWPQLQREKTITTVAGQESYALPPDLERFTFNAEWDRTNHWELLGPSSPQEWQWRKSGVSASVPRYRFRIKGVTNNRVFIDPTPATSGIVLVFEYVSTNWILPVTWTTGTVFLANKYCSYNGNIYSTSGGGVTGELLQLTPLAQSLMVALRGHSSTANIPSF